MSFQVNLTEEDTRETAGRLQEPVIAPAQLVDVTSKEIGNTTTYDVVSMSFTMDDMDHKGQQFEHLEWQPRKDEFTSQGDGDPEVVNQVKRLLHVLSRVTTVDKDKLRTLLNEAYTGSDLDEIWSDVRSLVDQLMERNRRTDLDLEIKVVGNTYKGGNLQFPRYPSFIRVVGEDPVLSFNDYDKKQNAAYMELQNEEPDTEEEFDELDDDDFDF